MKYSKYFFCETKFDRQSVCNVLQGKSECSNRDTPLKKKFYRGKAGCEHTNIYYSSLHSKIAAK